jgi:FMN reductase
MAVPVLVVSGSGRAGSHSRILADVALDALKVAGADTQLLDLSETILPILAEGDAAQNALPVVKRVRETAVWAHGFILVTPEYHGGLSGALKNWFDFLYPELAGKFAAVLSATGGGSGDMSIVATKNSFHWCHGFTLPYHAGAKHADFGRKGLENDTVRERIVRIAHDVVRYTPAIFGAFTAAKGLGKNAPTAGFAGHHA